MAFLGAPLPAEGAETVYAAVSAKADADQAPEDPRTKAQRRADALVGLCAGYLSGGCPSGVKIENDTGPVPRYHGLRPAINVSVALSTLLGLDEQPGELDGHGPIPASVARRIAADPTGTWRRPGTPIASRPPPTPSTPPADRQNKPSVTVKIKMDTEPTPNVQMTAGPVKIKVTTGRMEGGSPASRRSDTPRP